MDRRSVVWRSFAFAFVAVLFPFLAAPVGAQQPAAGTIAVYQDCQTWGCDSDLLRTEINYVNWVRDREVADVHVLVTAEGTGGGGRQFTVEFIGRRSFEGRGFDLEWASSGNATDDEQRRGLTRTIAYGLMAFIAERGVADRLRIEYDAPAEADEGGAGAEATGEVDDPWDFWVFSARMSAFLNGESTFSSQRLDGNLNARRTTEAWKASINLGGNRRETKQELPDRTVETVVKGWNSSGLLARSMGPHWTLGARANAGSSSYENQRLAVRMAPGVEYNIFPYSESTKRELVLLYSVGVNYFDWYDRTIYLEDEETRLDHTLTARLDLNQPWGQVSLFADGSQYLHDASLWRATLGGSFEVRLFKGFRLNAMGNYSWIEDQISIPAADLSDDEILTRQRQLATSFRYFTSFGISYTFGSIFNNVVNPRFGGGGGFGVVFF